MVELVLELGVTWEKIRTAARHKLIGRVANGVQGGRTMKALIRPVHPVARDVFECGPRQMLKRL